MFDIVFPVTPVIMCFCLRRNTWNSIKVLKFSSLIIKSSTVLFVQANCCFTPVFCNFFVSAIFFLEKRVQNNFPKNRVCLLGFAHVCYREFIKNNPDLVLSIQIQNVQLKQDPVTSELDSALLG